ncbi:hypothetical protein P10VF_120 [Rhizobium phage vB_RleM_P10VF]|uniref:Uncharacterized protein n=1 Tax=Rhizobium phage vB_RleM_P10VF TaxID=1527770 RepID=A0A076YIS2_9CAUD|nr:hypothetical protein P10VF_120 [Rhizobium phage vB_RleM_P10VF]AIK68333.1 hypothetical protein P10VF_120 [Rhizobium phage vB_RleM_P10VF]
MQLSDFFLIRDEFLKHVRRKLKGVEFNLKSKTFDSDQESFFRDFSHTKLLTEIGKNELAIIAIKELNKQTIDIGNRIKVFEEQIELTKRSGDTPKRKRIFTEEQQGHIDYFAKKYTPKFPSRDQNTFLLSSFDMTTSTEVTFRGFKQKCEIGPDVSFTVIGDAAFVKLKEHKVSDDKPYDKKDRMIWEEM